MFSQDFFECNLWYYRSAMLAFQPYQSLIEMRRYAVRFMHQLHLIKFLKQISRTKFDQYHSLILPLQTYLKNNGVQFVSNATVTDTDLDIQGRQKIVTALKIQIDGKEMTQAVGKEDMVFFTNGSMTQNSSRGSMTEAPVMNRDT
ncbi:MAG: oleate hydratase [Oribacterium sp.]|nr:oleate hydratase [Oribacterium sp.]